MKKLITTKLIKLKFAIISYVSIIACVAFYLSASQALAQAVSEDQSFTKKHHADLKKIELYLNNLKNLSATFIQLTSDGNLIEGNFFLSRPGKMRIEYSNNPPIVIVVNGSILSYYDVELDEISRLSTNTTPASFLTRPNISFSAKDVEVTNVVKSSDQIKVSVVKKNRKESGEFSLIFSRNPFSFIKMEVKNDLDQLIEVTLSEIDLTKPISNKKFILKKSDND